MKQLDWIPAGVYGNNWRQLKLTIEIEVKGQKLLTMGVQYRNVIKSIKFLLGHAPFALDLVYSSICQYNNKNERVYIEMHTGDW